MQKNINIYAKNHIVKPTIRFQIISVHYFNGVAFCDPIANMHIQADYQNGNVVCVQFCLPAYLKRVRRFLYYPRKVEWILSPKTSHVAASHYVSATKTHC